MGIDVDAGPDRLFEQFGEIKEVVSGDQDAWPCYHPFLDRGRLGVPNRSECPSSSNCITRKFWRPHSRTISKRLQCRS